MVCNILRRIVGRLMLIRDLVNHGMNTNTVLEMTESPRPRNQDMVWERG